jgi:hypothetical protein
MSEFLTWQALVMLLIGIFFGTSIKGALNKVKAKV